MGTTIADLGAMIGFVLFIVISLYLFSSLPNIFIKFVCAVMSVAGGWAGYSKVPRFDFAFFIVCLAVVLYYLLLRLADYITRKEGISLFEKK
jgi:hypothetical protein